MKSGNWRIWEIRTSIQINTVNKCIERVDVKAAKNHELEKQHLAIYRLVRVSAGLKWMNVCVSEAATKHLYTKHTNVKTTTGWVGRGSHDQRKTLRCRKKKLALFPQGLLILYMCHCYPCRYFYSCACIFKDADTVTNYLNCDRYFQLWGIINTFSCMINKRHSTTRVKRSRTLHSTKLQMAITSHLNVLINI